jgi:hypothetical protein
VRRISLFVLLLAISFPTVLSAYRVTYKEQYYRLYHIQFYQYPERITENIFWLQQALRADFANPLNALAVIETPREWEQYRYLFTMHVNLKLTELYLRWASKYFKQDAYFYNYPFQRQNLESLQIAEELLNRALPYWNEAKLWSTVAAETRGVHLEEIQHWHDESHRIENGNLDYEAIINRHLEHLEEVRTRFIRMNELTY